MSVISIQNASIKAYKSGTVEPCYNKNKLKEGYIWFNGCKIKICNSLKETARNINKLYKSTGIRAYIIKDKSGQEKLTLKVSGRVLNINDPQGLLAELYKKGKIGKNKDNIIRVIRRLEGKEEVQINYNKSFSKKENYKLDKLRLSEQNITYLAGYKINLNKNIENPILQLIANSKNFEETKIEDELLENDLSDIDFNISPESTKQVFPASYKNSKIPKYINNNNSNHEVSVIASIYSSNKVNISSSKTNSSNYKKPPTPRGYDKEYANRIREINNLKELFEKTIKDERIRLGCISQNTKIAIKESLPEVVKHFEIHHRLNL